MLSLLIVLWFLASALDDFFVLLAWLGSVWERERELKFPAAEDLGAVAEQRIAIFVAAWKEDSVIERMLTKNVAALRYTHYEFFVGTYPNDRATQEAVERAIAIDANHSARIRLVVGARPGPTSKADCLNAVYQKMCEVEASEGRFDLVVIHDAEDVLHPDELHWKNWFAQHYDMVQTAVLPVETPISQWTHGLYCDDFAEFHTKDMRARHWLGGFVPSCGVATAFKRHLLEELAASYESGLPFAPECLTEDYELGYRLRCLGARQIFVPLPTGNEPRLATREFFPQSLRSAARQRSRWVTGIVFQGWRNHAWGRNWFEAYWFWRDRKGLLGSPLGLAANATVISYLAFGWPDGFVQGFAGRLSFAAGVLAAVNLCARSWCSAKIYRWRFASLAPLRQLWGNVVNTWAVALAIRTVVVSLRSGKSLVWKKTEHIYPIAAGNEEMRSLAEILLERGAISKAELDAAMGGQPEGVELGDHLLRLGKVSAMALQSARNVQHGFRSGTGAAQPARLLPAHLTERWRVVPVGIGPGEIRLVSIDLPEPGLERELARHTRRRPRLHFVTPNRYGRLRGQYHRGEVAEELQTAKK